MPPCARTDNSPGYFLSGTQRMLKTCNVGGSKLSTNLPDGPETINVSKLKAGGDACTPISRCDWSHASRLGTAMRHVASACVQGDGAPARIKHRNSTNRQCH